MVTGQNRTAGWSLAMVHEMTEENGTEDREIALPPEEEESFEIGDSQEPVPPDDIIAYNEVRSCADLFRLYTSGKMELQPDFQREVVWKKNERARFIDSLVKQLPIPSMCFSLDPKTQTWKVIDGLQRMTSITDFLGNNEWRLEALDDIHPLLQGNTNLKLRTGDDASRIVYASVENVTVPVTVIRCDYSKHSHMRYLFTIFHRLNSGSVRLNNQEIRNCIYSGHLNDALKQFDRENADWQVIKRRIWGSVERFRSVEILLRVLAFEARLNQYDGNIADFLNTYMHNNASISLEAAKAIQEKLVQVISITRSALKESGAGKLSLAVIEGVLVGVCRNLATLAGTTEQQVITKFFAMQSMSSFSEGARYAVSSSENVKKRLGEAITAFSPMAA